MQFFQVKIKSNKPCIVSEGYSLRDLNKNNIVSDGIVLWLIKRLTTSADSEPCNTNICVPLIYKDYFIYIETNNGQLEVEYIFKFLNLTFFAYCLIGLLIAVSAEFFSKQETSL